MRWLPLLGLMGCLDAAALSTIIAAGNLPDPAFTTVVSSAFGAVTVLLARAFLKEPISLAQLAGMILIFGGVATLERFQLNPDHSLRRRSNWHIPAG
jgi:drug/metabolite transporter (DMT)-like permease